MHWLLPAREGIPVLMYHRIWPGCRDRITQTPEQLREQWVYLKEQGYEAISLQEYAAWALGTEMPAGRKVLITFDDGYVNNLSYAYPLLQELGFKASFFLIAETLEGNTDAGDPLQQKMNVQQLRSLDSSVVQFAMHGYRHEHFGTTPLADVKRAIETSMELFRQHDLPLHPSLAYPYGGRPKNKKDFEELKSWMKNKGIQMAFRIGNAVSSIPCEDAYEIKRIDIRGTDSLDDFKIKVRKGKLRPF